MKSVSLLDLEEPEACLQCRYARDSHRPVWLYPENSLKLSKYRTGYSQLQIQEGPLHLGVLGVTLVLLSETVREKKTKPKDEQKFLCIK